MHYSTNRNISYVRCVKWFLFQRTACSSFLYGIMIVIPFCNEKNCKHKVTWPSECLHFVIKKKWHVRTNPKLTLACQFHYTGFNRWIKTKLMKKCNLFMLRVISCLLGQTRITGHNVCRKKVSFYQLFPDIFLSIFGITCILVTNGQFETYPCLQTWTSPSGNMLYTSQIVSLHFFPITVC